MTSESSRELAALVPTAAAEDAIAALRTAGVYDESRSVADHDADHVALPVTRDPRDHGAVPDTDVAAVVEADLPSRERGLPDLLRERGWSAEEVDAAPGSWAVIGSVVLVELDGVPRPEEVGEALLDLHGDADTVLDHRGVSGTEREPDVAVVAGDGDTETVHREHGTRYALDLATVMFSPGNKAERARMGEVVSGSERVFDMFAGVGYFTLPMARAGATVTATEINPAAFRYLLENAMLNDVDERVQAYRADCRDVETTADRVVMGYYDAHEYLDAALDALVAGGELHMHEATPEARLPDRPVSRLEAACRERDRDVEVHDVRRVKSHSEGVQHVVVDATVE